MESNARCNLHGVQTMAEATLLQHETVSDEPLTPRSSAGVSSSDASSLPSASSDITRGMFQDEFSNMVEQLSRNHVRMASIEEELQSVQQEKLQQEYKQNLYIQRLEAQIAKLEQQSSLDMEELKRRQDMIQERIPSIEEQFKSLKDVLNDLNISEALYCKLIAEPKENRTVREHLLILAYEKWKKHREELHSSQQERDSAREALSRENDEVRRLQRELQRVTTVLTSEKRDLEREVSALASRNERLEVDLRDAIVQAQISCAKVSLYDEVKEKLEKVEFNLAEVEKQRNEASRIAEVLMAEKKQQLESIGTKDQYLWVLETDKAYLKKQIKSLEENLVNLEFEKQQQKLKITELEESQKKLYDHFLHDRQDSEVAKEQRMQAELLRMQDRTNNDVELIRRELVDSATCEARMLREMRDLAIQELEKVQGAIKDNKSAYEELMLRYKDLQRSADARNADSQVCLQIKEFELNRLKLLEAERQDSLNKSKLENEQLADKIKVLTEKFYTMKADLEKQEIELKMKLCNAEARLEQYELQERNFDKSLQDASKILIEGSEDEDLWAAKMSSACPTSMQQRFKFFLHLAKKCTQLQDKVKILESEKETLRNQLEEKKKEVSETNDMLKHMKQPPSYLVDVIQKTELKLREALRRIFSLDTELRECKLEKEKTTFLLQNLREDLKKLLKARGNIDSLQKILVEKDSNMAKEVLQKILISRDIS